MDYTNVSKKDLVAAVMDQGLMEHQVEAEQATRGALIALLSGETDPAAEEPPAEEATKPTKAAKPAKAAIAKALATKGQPDRVKLTIFEQDGPSGGDDVTVSVNGTAYQIKRGVEVEVPYGVVHVLENAVITQFDPLKEGGVRERNVKRFNFSVRT